MDFLIACIYFYLPAAIANIGAVISKFVPIFNAIKTPVDLGKSINGTRIVGDHKTVGGFAFGVIFGTMAGMAKYLLLDGAMDRYLLLRLDFWSNLRLYLLMSFFALTGDIVKSVVKRLFRIAPHKAWIPFDEIDHSSFAMVAAMIAFGVSGTAVVTVIFVFFFLHIIANVVGYLLKIKTVPY